MVIGALLIVGVLAIILLVVLVDRDRTHNPPKKDLILEARLRHLEDTQAKILEHIGQQMGLNDGR
jgi:hypothetical protein